MGNYAAGTKLSDLSLDDAPTGSANPRPPDAPLAACGPPSSGAIARNDARAVHTDMSAAAVGPSSPGVNAETHAPAERTDPLLEEATREFEAGHIEQPLWVRAIAQSGGDPAAAKPAYLRARAASLRVAKRTQRHDGATRGAHARSSKKGTPQPSDAVRPRRTLDRGRMMLTAGVIGLLVVVITLVAMRWESAPAQAPIATAPKLTAGGPGPTADSAKSAAKTPGGPGRPEMASDDFAGRVREFKEAGNWNVLVLYAAEWTRKQPTNPEAWKELGTGYAALRQFDDALDAVTKAVRLAPEDFQSWQTLGQINLALAQPAKALVAFERAADLNARDVTSLIQAGTLNAELGHLSQAKDAFNKALAVSPGDVEALCGAASVAQKDGRPKDAEAFTRQVKAIERTCREPTAESVPVAAATATKKRPVYSGR